MEINQFKRVTEAFEKGCTLPPGDRTRFASTEFPDDAEARAELLDLLRLHERNSDLVGTAAGLEAAGTVLTPASGDIPANSHAAPKLRGDYRILRTIGEGGMGVVFEAEQAFPRRRVALKALRPGLASERMLRRFRNEAEFLARLQHPNIAQIYDAGVADSNNVDQAYFAMELVEGTTLTQYATAHNLSIKDRWTLLLRVCDAMQHAHQRGVIHRDLKPANILVTQDGTPKVVDFGVARAVQSELMTHAPASMATREGQLIGTPAYMSPEQLRSGDIDTRSDIYAIGIVAYELLSGVLPFDVSSKPITQAIAMICDTDAPPLSAHNRVLAGDAEIIVSKAMAKEPDRRYTSAAELGEDIRRLLAGEGILARRDSAMYVLGKQLRRHRAVSAFIAVGLASLFAFAIYASVNAKRQSTLALSESIAKSEAVTAQRSAERASEAAKLAQHDAERSKAQALDELTHSTIAQGRMAAATGNLPLAEDILWPAYFKSPSLPAAKWGLREMYAVTGSKWTKVISNAGNIHVSAAAKASVVVSGAGDTLRFINPETGENIREPLKLAAPIAAISTTADGKCVYVATTKNTMEVVAIEAAPAQQVEWMGLPVAPATLRFLAISANGRVLAGVSSDGTVTLWNAATGAVQGTAKFDALPTAFAINSDASLCVIGTIGGSNTPMMSIVRPQDQMSRIIIAEQPTASPPVFRFGSDDKTLYFENDRRRLVAWDVLANKKLLTSSSDVYRLTIISLSPDGSRVFASDADSWYLFDAHTGGMLRALPHDRYFPTGIAWLNNDEVMVLTYDGLARRVSLFPKVTYATFPYDGWCFSVAFSPDGNLVGVGGGSRFIDACDTASNTIVSRYEPHMNALRTRGLQFLSDNRTLVAGSADGVVRILDSYTGEITRSFATRSSEVYSLAIDPSERFCVTGHSDRTAVVCDVATGAHLCTLPTMEKRIEGLAFSNDGSTLVVSGNARGLVLWNVNDEQVAGILPTVSQPWGVEFSPDGNTLYATTQGGSLEVFDWPSKTRRAAIQGHQRLAPGLAVSPDGQYVATAGEEGMINLWDTASLHVIATFKPQSSTIVDLAFSPDSRTLAAATAARATVLINLYAHDQDVAGHESWQREKQGIKD